MSGPMAAAYTSHYRVCFPPWRKDHDAPPNLQPPEHDVFPSHRFHLRLLSGPDLPPWIPARFFASRVKVGVFLRLQIKLHQPRFELNRHGCP
jgi:hypothetical protein